MACIGDGRGLIEIRAPAGSTYAARGPWGWFNGTDSKGNPRMVPVNPSGTTCIITDVCGYPGGQWRVIVKLPDGTMKDSGFYDMSKKPRGNNAKCYFLFNAAPQVMYDSHGCVVGQQQWCHTQKTGVLYESCIPATSACPPQTDIHGCLVGVQKWCAPPSGLTGVAKKRALERSTCINMSATCPPLYTAVVGKPMSIYDPEYCYPDYIYAPSV